MSALLIATLLAVASPAANDGPVLTLEQALQQGKEKNADLRVARARLGEARETAAKVWANQLPQVSVGGSYTRNNIGATISLPTGYYIRQFPICGQAGSPPPPNCETYEQVSGPPFDPTQPPGISNPPGGQTAYGQIPSGLVTATIQKQNQWGGQAQVVVPVIVPPLWPAIANAYTIEDVAALNVDNAQREILFAIAQLYYGALGLRRTIDVQARQLEITHKHEKDAQVRFEAGSVPKSALLRAEIDRSRAEQDLKRAQNAYASARQALATLLDRDPDFSVEIPPEPKLPADAAQLEQTALADRPDVLSAKKSVEINQRLLTGSWLKYLPTVAVTGQYRLSNITGFTGQYYSWAIMAGLNWTLFDGGAREAELRENRLKVAEAEAAQHAAELKARDEVVRAKLDLDSAIANREKAQEQLRLARENIDIVNVSYQSGAATYLEVEDANAALLGAELGGVAEQLNASVAALKLLKAAGRFNP